MLPQIQALAIIVLESNPEAARHKEFLIGQRQICKHGLQSHSDHSSSFAGLMVISFARMRRVCFQQNAKRIQIALKRKLQLQLSFIA